MNNNYTIFILIISVSIVDGSGNYKPTSDQLRCTTTSTAPALPPKGAPFFLRPGTLLQILHNFIRQH